jgi:hypothetical protein
MAINVSPVPSPSSYSINEENLLNPSVVSATFNPSVNYIEYIITDSNETFKLTDLNYNRFSFPTDGTVTSNEISSIIFDPANDIATKNLNAGEYITYYNFFQNEVSTSPSDRYLFIKEISSDRTEIKVGFTYIFTSLETIVSSLKITNSNYFKEFYLNFGDGDTILSNNVRVDSNNTLIFNLYQPLPSNIQTNSSFWIVTKIADTLSFNISITQDPFVPTISSTNIQGPNFNLPIKDQTNNTTGYLDYTTLLQIQSVSSSNQIKSLLAEKGIDINIDYTDFNNFIHFSSAYQRLTNFYYKVQQIEGLTNQINSLSSVTNSSSSINNYQSQITNIITNFDDYDYYLYYSSGSWAWPKSTSTLPYTLYSTGSAQVINWLGSADNLTGILGSASRYDEDNQDSLYYSIPEYIRDDDRNTPYYLFLEMIGNYYDNIWTYYKDVTNLHIADNRLDYGISKDLVAEALKSFGIKIYQNNFTTQDLYAAFLGYTSNNYEITGSLPVTAGSFQEYINSYITASYDASVIPLDDYNKEIYKRLYHNLPYLLKAKGTIPGLRALINCFGVPDTVLRISEFGGRDKDISTYDYFDQKYNYEYLASGINYVTSSFILNSNWGADNNRPECIQFRIKPGELPTTNIPYSQSILILNTASSDTSALILRYTGSGYTSASYPGSTYSASYQYANLEFIPRIGSPSISASVYLPFYDEGWWSVMINRTSTTEYTLYAGNKLYYDGYDGNQIGFISSASVTANNANNGGYNGNSASFASGSITIGGNTYQNFSGSIQEIRFWSKTGSAEALKDFIMNPSSIDYENLENEYSSYLAFRLPLGNELYTGSTSVHPKISGSWVITSSFSGISTAYISNTSSFQSNIESFFYDQPIAGIKNRVTDKIQIVSSSFPTGSVLSQYRSLEQTYPSLGSETPDINLLEVAFSPQNEINNDIISSLGYFNIGEYIGDPRQVSSTSTTYPDLVNLSNNFFQKYFESYNLFDYIRLIKYFDNSLFKMIQDFVPARTSLTSGVVIKQHLLERNKYPQPQIEWENVTYEGSIYSQQIWDESISGSYISSSLIEKIEGSTGGVFNSYNNLAFTQSWVEEIKTPVGLLFVSHSDQSEFYNGQLPYSDILVSNGELNPDNQFKQVSIDNIEYSIIQYENGTGPYTLPPGIPSTNFLSSIYAPSTGQIYTWFDIGSTINPGSNILSITNGVKYVKINKIDKNGANKSDLLGQITTISFIFLNGPQTYNISGIQEFNNYYLYSIGPYLPNSTNNFNTGSVNTPIIFVGTTSSAVFNPSYLNFDFNDYNPLINNVDLGRPSVTYMDVDYSQNPTIPINQTAIINGTADKANVPDSNYSTYSWSNIRYNGSKNNSVKFN